MYRGFSQTLAWNSLWSHIKKFSSLPRGLVESSLSSTWLDSNDILKELELTQVLNKPSLNTHLHIDVVGSSSMSDWSFCIPFAYRCRRMWFMRMSWWLLVMGITRQTIFDPRKLWYFLGIEVARSHMC
jgi:hypothetical protein